MIVGPSGVGKSSLINALRSNDHPSDAAADTNWFEPVGSLVLVALVFICDGMK